MRELKIQGVRAPYYNRRADLICFVNGLPLVFIELKAVYRNIRAGFDDNLTDYLSEHSIAHAFHHNVFLVVSNGDQAVMVLSRVSGSILSNGSAMLRPTKHASMLKVCLMECSLKTGFYTSSRISFSSTTAELVARVKSWPAITRYWA